MQKLKNVVAMMALMLCAGWQQAAQAQAAQYPARPVRIIIGFGPGSAADVATRTLADGLTQLWGQTVIVDNRPGASGIIAVQELKKAKPDGYDFLFGDVGTMAINPSYFRKLPYDAERDLVPVVDIFWTPFIVWVSKDAPFNSLKDLIAASKAAPGKFTYASTGPGSPIFVGTESLKLAAGMDILQVPYKDMGGLLTDVASGEVTMVVTSAATVRPIIGKLKPLAIAARQRHPDFPDIPTSAESGGPASFEVTGWGALVALHGTPKAIIDKVRADALTVMQRPQIRERATSLGLTLSRGKTTDEMVQFVQSERDRYGAVVKATGLRGD